MVSAISLYRCVSLFFIVACVPPIFSSLCEKNESSVIIFVKLSFCVFRLLGGIVLNLIPWCIKLYCPYSSMLLLTVRHVCALSSSLFMIYVVSSSIYSTTCMSLFSPCILLSSWYFITLACVLIHWIPILDNSARHYLFPKYHNSGEPGYGTLIDGPT